MIDGSHFRRKSLAASGAALLLPCLLAPQGAWADTRVGAVVGLDGGYSTRPFGNSGSSGGAATVTGRATVRLNSTHETGQINGDATINHTEYSRIYDSKTNYNAGLGLLEQLSERTKLSLSGRFDSSVVDSNDALLNPISLGNNPDLPQVIDPSAAFLQRQRRNIYSAGLSVDHSFSEADTVTVSAQGVATRADGIGTLREYDYGSGSVAYSHQFNARLSVGGSFTAARSNYLGTGPGDAWTYSPQLTAKLDLGRGWSLSGSGGVTFSQTDIGGGIKENSTAASGSLQLCKRDERFSGCLSASRSVLPSSFGSVGNATSIGVSASYRLDEFSSLSGSVSYSKNSGTASAQAQDFLRSNISYSRRITSRLSGLVSGGYSDSYSGLINNRSNLFGTVGISYSIGMLK